jgi:hypothetical protein
MIYILVLQSHRGRDGMWGLNMHNVVKVYVDVQGCQYKVHADGNGALRYS